MLVVRKRNTIDAGASLPPLQPVERLVESALEGGGKGHWMESGQMPACANLCFHGKMRSSGDGLPGSYRRREVPAKTSGGARAGGARAGLKVFGPGAVSLSFR